MKILVVDDEPDVKFLFEQKFRKEIRMGDFEFSFCYSGEEALSFLYSGESEVVMILSDINMPGMSGIDLLKRIRVQYPAAPPVVMMMTAYGDDNTYSEAMKYGANDLWTKPIDFVGLKGKLVACK